MIYRYLLLYYVKLLYLQLDNSIAISIHMVCYSLDDAGMALCVLALWSSARINELRLLTDSTELPLV